MNPEASPAPPDAEDQDERRRPARARAVLDALADGAAVRDVPPDPEPPAWGARSAVASAWDTNSVVARVYVFDSYGDARAVEDRLADSAMGGRVGVTGVNGPLLLWATADADDPAGSELLIDLQSAFAGEE